MTDTEMIALQSKRIESMAEELATLRQGIENARDHIVCIGGPLNDDCRGFTEEQKDVFRRINNALPDCLGDE